MNDLIPFYIVGQLSKHTTHDHTMQPVIAAITPTRCGWKCRSTLRNALNHDYVSFESTEHIREWLELQVHPRDSFITQNREEVAERLAIRLASNDVLGFLAPDANLSPDAAAERLLQHLECGW